MGKAQVGRDGKVLPIWMSLLYPGQTKLFQAEEKMKAYWPLVLSINNGKLDYFSIAEMLSTRCERSNSSFHPWISHGNVN